MSRVSTNHAYIVGKITAQIDHWISYDGGFGMVFAGEGEIRIANGNSIAYDIAWTSEELSSIAMEGPATEIFPVIVEVISKANSYQKLMLKIFQYLEGGAQEVWVIAPILRQVHVFRPMTPMQMIAYPNSYRPSDLMPGFKLDLELFFKCDGE